MGTETDDERPQQGGKAMSNYNWNYSISWTQPYAGWNTEHKEIVRLEIVDNIVASMDTYPDAERLLKNIFSSQ